MKNYNLLTVILVLAMGVFLLLRPRLEKSTSPMDLTSFPGIEGIVPGMSEKDLLVKGSQISSRKGYFLEPEDSFFSVVRYHLNEKGFVTSVGGVKHFEAYSMGEARLIVETTISELRRYGFEKTSESFSPSGDFYACQTNEIFCLLSTVWEGDMAILLVDLYPNN